MIDIRGLDKAEVLKALYNASHPQGMGMLQFSPGPLTDDEVKKCMAHGTYFDYVKGRVMKVEIGGDDLDPRLYDRDNGDGAAFRALEELLTRPKAKA